MFCRPFHVLSFYNCAKSISLGGKVTSLKSEHKGLRCLSGSPCPLPEARGSIYITVSSITTLWKAYLEDQICLEAHIFAWRGSMTK